MLNITGNLLIGVIIFMILGLINLFYSIIYNKFKDGGLLNYFYNHTALEVLDYVIMGLGAFIFGVFVAEL